MTSRDFCYWLQGYLELTTPKRIDEKEVILIQRHLNMVFKHEIDPSFNNAEELRSIHSPGLKEVIEKEQKSYSGDFPITC
jgi:hypothetical protein